MRLVARILAVAIAMAGVMAPSIRVTRSVPLAVDVRLPPQSDPEYDRAVALREELASSGGATFDLEAADPPQAIVIVGAGHPPDELRTPVFVFRPRGDAKALRVRQLETDMTSIPGQTVRVTAVVEARGLTSEKTSVVLERDGVELDRIDHAWREAEQSQMLDLSFVPTRAGLQRVRIVAAVPGVARAVADLGVPVRDRQLAVLVHEPRPSWAATFVRRSLESDPTFEVTAWSGTSRHATTTLGQPPASLASANLDRYDVIIVGAPEELDDLELRALEAFVDTRGGQLLLLPDRRLPDRLRRRFGLPAMDEVLLDRPATVSTGETTIRASELLLARGAAAPGFDALAHVSQGSIERPAILAGYHGAGRVIVSGLMDAWRYRGTEAGTEMFWRGFVADAAVKAPPRLSVRVEPSLARPGEDLVVTVGWRRTEFASDRGPAEIPAVSASLVAADGGREMIRLWPSTPAGTYEARLRAPAAGEYVVSAAGEGATSDALLRVEPDVVHAVSDRSAAQTFTAHATGGAIVSDVGELKARLDGIQRGTVDVTIRPLESAWWIVPFAGLLSLEWAARRREGLR